MHSEVELKLLIAPTDIWRLQRHPLLKALTRRKLPSQRLVSVYYDTPDLALRKHSVAVRLRRVGRRWLQTVKAEGSVAAGLHERPEWESETVENTLDFNAINNPKLRKFLAAKELQQELRPVFLTEFVRSRRLLASSSGDIVEFALDRGDIRAGDQRLPICEVELELKSGNPARLFEVALGLQETIPLRLENVSKAERGYQLATHAALAPGKAKTPELAEELSAHDAFIRVMQSCLTHLQANEAGALRGEDPEFVHQMRVALRRLRSALSVFSDLVPKEKALPIREELRWLTAELDGARNWDVFVLETLPPIVASFPAHGGLGWLETKSAEIRQQHNVRARDAIASRRYQKLLLNLGAWLCTQPWRDTADVNAQVGPPVVDFAAQVLQKHHRQLEKRGKHIATLSPPERHAVRIAAKKLRYAAEFFLSLYLRKQAHKYIAALSGLQDVLGTLNDAATTIALLQEIINVGEHDDSRQHAKETIHGWILGMSHVQLKDLERVWENFLDQTTFW